MAARRLPPALGPRGEGWVGLQFLVLGVVLVMGLVGPGWPGEAGLWLRTGAVILLIGGGALGVSGVRSMGSHLTPFPKPNAGAPVVAHGTYRWVRHPMYGSLILLSVAWALATSPWAFVPAVVLALVLWAKSVREEAWLLGHDASYADYRQRVRRRFIPWIW